MIPPNLETAEYVVLSSNVKIFYLKMNGDHSESWQKHSEGEPKILTAFLCQQRTNKRSEFFHQFTIKTVYIFQPKDGCKI